MYYHKQIFYTLEYCDDSMILKGHFSSAGTVWGKSELMGRWMGVMQGKMFDNAKY